MREHKLILWDIDGTLVNCGRDGTIALNHTFEELYGIQDAFNQAGIGHAMDFAILEKVMALFQIKDSDIEQIKKTYTVKLKEVLDHDHNKYIPNGVEDILTYIEKNDYLHNCLLTTNFKAGAMLKLEAAGIHSHFHVGGFGDDKGEKWDAFLTGIAEAEKYYNIVFSKESMYIIGDSSYDIECGKKMGIKTIGVGTGYTPSDILISHNPDYFFDDLSNTDDIINILES